MCGGTIKMDRSSEYTYRLEFLAAGAGSNGAAGPNGYAASGPGGSGAKGNKKSSVV